MSSSLLNKGSMVLHAIAFTLALAIATGQLPLSKISFSQLQFLLPNQQHDAP